MCSIASALNCHLLFYLQVSLKRDNMTCVNKPRDIFLMLTKAGSCGLAVLSEAGRKHWDIRPLLTAFLELQDNFKSSCRARGRPLRVIQRLPFAGSSASHVLLPVSPLLSWEPNTLVFVLGSEQWGKELAMLIRYLVVYWFCPVNSSMLSQVINPSCLTTTFQTGTADSKGSKVNRTSIA